MKLVGPNLIRKRKKGFSELGSDRSRALSLPDSSRCSNEKKGREKNCRAIVPHGSLKYR